MVKTCDLASDSRRTASRTQSDLRRLLRARGASARAGLPGDVGPLSPGRAPAGIRTRPLRHRCAARVGRVRPSDHRRQARAAGAGSLPSLSSLAGRDPSAGGHCHGIRTTGGRCGSRGRARRGAQARRHDFRAARAAAVRIRSSRRRRIHFIHQELIEILYHTLWETVHVFFEHRELGHDVGDSAFLYPFLGEEKQQTGDIVDQVAASIRAKAQEDAQPASPGGPRGIRTNRRRRRAIHSAPELKAAS